MGNFRFTYLSIAQGAALFFRPYRPAPADVLSFLGGRLLRPKLFMTQRRLACFGRLFSDEKFPLGKINPTVGRVTLLLMRPPH